MRRRLRFEFKYWFGRPPWDTGVSPSELLDFLAHHPPGRAIDFGCGTGTNAITIASHGWEVTGVDFSWRALFTARRKALAAGVQVRFLKRSVSHLDDLDDPFDLGLDLGCYHSLEPDVRLAYVAGVTRLMRPGSTFLMYSFLAPDEGWPSEDEVRRSFEGPFRLERLERGEYNGRPSGWFTWIRGQ